jgi:hypothetical protein
MSALKRGENMEMNSHIYNFKQRNTNQRESYTYTSPGAPLLVLLRLLPILIGAPRKRNSIIALQYY